MRQAACCGPWIKVKNPKAPAVKREAYDFASRLERAITRSGAVPKLIEARATSHNDYPHARLENEITNYAEWSELVVQLTKIASDSMANVNRRSVEGESRIRS